MGYYILMFLTMVLNGRAGAISCLHGKAENVEVGSDPTDTGIKGVCETQCAVYVKFRTGSTSHVDYRYGCGTVTGLQAEVDKYLLVGDWISWATTTADGNTGTKLALIKTKPVACITFDAQKFYPKVFTRVPADKVNCIIIADDNDGFQAFNVAGSCAKYNEVYASSGTRSAVCCKTFMCDPREVGPLACLSTTHMDKPIKSGPFERSIGSTPSVKKPCAISYDMRSGLWNQFATSSCTDTATSTATTPSVVKHCCSSTVCNTLASTASALHCYNNGAAGPLAWKFNLLSGEHYCVWTKNKANPAEYVQTFVTAANFENSANTDCAGIHGRVRTTATHYVYCCKTMLCNRPPEEWLVATSEPAAPLTCFSGSVPNTATTHCPATAKRCYWKYTPGSTSALPVSEQGCTDECPNQATCSLGSLSNLIPVQESGELYCFSQAEGGVGEYTTTVLLKCGAGQACYSKLSSDGKFVQGCAVTTQPPGLDVVEEKKRDRELGCKGKMLTPTVETNYVFTCCRSHGCNIPEPHSCLYTPVPTTHPVRTISKLCPMGTQSCRAVAIGGLYMQGCAAPTSAISSDGCQLNNCNVVKVTSCYQQISPRPHLERNLHSCAGMGIIRSSSDNDYLCFYMKDSGRSPPEYTTDCTETTEPEFTTNCQGKYNELVADSSNPKLEYFCCTYDNCNHKLPPTTTTTPAPTKPITPVAPSGASRIVAVVLVTLLFSQACP